MTLLPVKDNPGLFRETKTNSIINTDEKSYQAHLKKKRLNELKKQQELIKENRINTLEQKVESIEQKLDKILELLA